MLSFGTGNRGLGKGYRSARRPEDDDDDKADRHCLPRQAMSAPPPAAVRRRIPYFHFLAVHTVNKSKLFAHAQDAAGVFAFHHAVPKLSCCF